jgi:PAS domain S-box-containing protein
MIEHNFSFQLDEQNELYHSAWDYSPEANLLLNSSGRILHFNKTFSSMFGFQEIRSNSILDLWTIVVKDSIEKLKSDFQYSLEHNELKNCEYEGVKLDYSNIPILISFKKIHFKGREEDFILAVIKDHTKSKIDERALRNSKERAEIADKLKSSFLANMSHEIRTPINAVIGFADLLSDPDLLEDEKLEYIRTIQVNGELLLKLINDIIDIAKIESGQLKIQKNNFSIDQLMDEIYLSSRNMIHQYEKPNIFLNKHIDSDLVGKYFNTDQYRLMQIINNLLSNAIKFTEKGSIDFGVRLLENNKPEFWVKDTGIGIEETELDYIFERFGQVEAALDHNIGGTGLGLNITKSLVELLGGKIKVQSSINNGSTFSFTIETNFINGKIPNPIAPKINLKGKKILIVEDIESNYRLLNILLEKQGAETIWATNGNQGILICKNSRDIDLVLMDINLPDIDGYEATSAIKAFRPNLPIVAQTAYAMAGEKDRSAEFGCDGYLAKPIIPEKLYNVICNLIY